MICALLKVPDMFTKTIQCIGDGCTRWIDGVPTSVGAVYCTMCVARIDANVSKNYGCSRSHIVVDKALATTRLPKGVASIMCKSCVCAVDAARRRLSDEAHDRWLQCNDDDDDDGWTTVWTSHAPSFAQTH